MPDALCRDCAEFADADGLACPACGSARRIAHPELAALTVAHVDCDAFYASVEKRDRPEIREQPLIVGHPGGRGVVTTACYIARRFGVRSAMPMFQALEKCPDAVVIPPDMAKYKAVSHEIREIFESATEIIEPVSLDEAYLDLEHQLDGLAGPPARLLAEIALRVEAEVGITVSIGLAPNKFLAKLASELQKPRGYSVIGKAEARSFLAGLSISKINGVGAVTAERMQALGFRTIGDLQAASEMQLTTQFGKLGRRLARFAHGEDDRRVTPDRATKSISAETTFRRDTGSAAELIGIADRLCERVSAQLTRKSLAGGAVVLKLKTSDFRIISRSQRLPNPTQRADVLMKAARRLIERECDGRTFRLIGVGADQLSDASDADPPDLFGDA
jgi:DNA polymerase-4